MARQYTNTKRAIGYQRTSPSTVDDEERLHIFFVAHAEEVEFDTFGVPSVTLKQARTIANKLLQWCDTAKEQPNG